MVFNVFITQKTNHLQFLFALIHIQILNQTR